MKFKKCCAFTGNREMGDDINEEKVKELLRGLIINKGVHTFYDGMARGFDLLCAKCVIELKKEFPQIKLIACVPCPKQEKYFKSEDKKLYYEVLEGCDQVKLISKFYFDGCMFVRNRYMVDNAGKVVVYQREEDGGTAYTHNYAVEQGKEIYLL